MQWLQGPAARRVGGTNEHQCETTERLPNSNRLQLEALPSCPREARSMSEGFVRICADQGTKLF